MAQPNPISDLTTVVHRRQPDTLNSHFGRGAGRSEKDPELVILLFLGSLFTCTFRIVGISGNWIFSTRALKFSTTTRHQLLFGHHRYFPFIHFFFSAYFFTSPSSSIPLHTHSLNKTQKNHFSVYPNWRIGYDTATATLNRSLPFPSPPLLLLLTFGVLQIFILHWTLHAGHIINRRILRYSYSPPYIDLLRDAIILFTYFYKNWSWKRHKKQKHYVRWLESKTNTRRRRTSPKRSSYGVGGRWFLVVLIKTRVRRSTK